MLILTLQKQHVQDLQAEQRQEKMAFSQNFVKNGAIQYLQNEIQQEIALIEAFRNNSFSLKQYNALLGTPYIWKTTHTGEIIGSIDMGGPSPEPIRSYLSTSHETKDGDYLLYSDALTVSPRFSTILTYPLTPDETLVVIKPVPLEKLAPPGAFNATLYQGNEVSPQTFIGAVKKIPGTIPQGGSGMNRPLPPGPPFNRPPLLSQGQFRPGEGRPHHPRGPLGPRHGRPTFPRGQFAPPSEHFQRAQEELPSPTTTPATSITDTPENWLERIFPASTQDTLTGQIPIYNRQNEVIATVVIQGVRPGKKPPKPFLNLGIVLLATGSIFSLLAGSYLKRNFLSPLLNLISCTQALKKGDFTTQIDDTLIKQPDMKLAMQHFNHMVNELEEKEKQRDSFIACITHDLRTPLIAQERTLAILAAEFDKLNLPGEAKLARGLTRNNQHLLSMINQLLETYQFEAEKTQLFQTTVNLHDMVNQCIDQLTSLAAENEITLKAEYLETLPPIQADRDYLKRVFVNLIGNAISNIPRRSTVWITGEQTFQGYVKIHVRDNGPGISPEDQEHLFERYTVGRDTRKIGSGLGLYICRMLIEAHHGTISLSSKLNEYTDFCIVLPISGPVEEQRTNERSN